ncbi:MAG: hypothetical protein AB8E74_05030 [Prochlorococcus sp.]
MASSTRLEKQPRQRPRFWLGPLVAGGCFALGYGITQRIVILQSSWQKPGEQTFQSERFPGNRLQSLRTRHGDDQAGLQADVAAFEVEQAGKRKLSEAAEKLAVEARRREQDLQASLLKPAPAVKVTSWTPAKPAAAELVSPQPELPEPVTMESAQDLQPAQANPTVQPNPAAQSNPTARSTEAPAIPAASPGQVEPQANGLPEFVVAPVPVFEAVAPLQTPPPAATNQPLPTPNFQPAPAEAAQEP